MVLEGQYLERPALITRRESTADQGGITLEGLYHRGTKAPGLVVCAPHPRLGGSMDSPVVAELAWAVTRQGHGSLRFNYQGVGASEGERQPSLPPGPQPLSVLASEIEDAAAAVKHLSETLDHGRIAIAGYSYGAAVALALALRDPLISHLLLVAPPTALFDFEALARVDRPVFLGLAQKDDLVDRMLLNAIVAGRSNVKIEVIAGAEHTFTRGLTELGKLAARWLSAA